MSVHVDVPAGKSFVLDGPASVRVGPNESMPALFDAPPAPTLASIAPDTAEIGSPDIEMTVTGTGFTHYSQIVFNGGDEPTTYVSDTELRTMVKPSTASSAIAVPVTVRNGGKVSESVDFTFAEPVGSP